MSMRRRAQTFPGLLVQAPGGDPVRKMAFSTDLYGPTVVFGDLLLVDQDGNGYLNKLTTDPDTGALALASGYQADAYRILTTHDLGSTGGTTGPANTDALPEGATNEYFTDARAQAALATRLAAKADLVNGLVPLAQVPYNGLTSQNVKTAVVNTPEAGWSSGEMGDSYYQQLPAGSAPGQKFIGLSLAGTSYVFECMNASRGYQGAAQTPVYTWVRWAR